MTAIILEDERIAADRLIRMLNDLAPNMDITHRFSSVEELSNHLVHHKAPDILFLDIQVEDGISLEIFNTMPISSQVIFTTAYGHYAVEAFRKNAIDYLLKPIKRSELAEALMRIEPINQTAIKAIYNKSDIIKKRFLVNFGAKIHIVDHSNIAYIFCENKISYFVAHDGKRVPSGYKVQDILSDLDPSLFFRLNRQVIAHISSIKDIIKHTKSRVKVRLQPTHHQEIVISTETTPRFKKWMAQ